MSRFSQFAHGSLKPSSAYIEDLFWICLDGSVREGVSRHAQRSLLPLQRAILWNLENCRPANIDWGREADWYERDYHWRGWIPRDALGNGIIPNPQDRSLRANLSESGQLGRHILGADTVSAALRLNNLLSDLRQLLSADLRRIPVPLPLDLSLLDVTVLPGLAAEHFICRFSYEMVDLVGFFRWAQVVFDKEIDSQNSTRRIEKAYKWLDDNFSFAYVGYLVHLEYHYREFGFRLCVEHQVPIYYPWNNNYDNIECFRRLNPLTLGVYAPDETLAVTRSLRNRFEPYDQYLQKSGGLSDVTREVPGMAQRTHYAVDFEGWTRRSLRPGESSGNMGRMFYWEDVMDLGNSLRIHFLWRPKAVDHDSDEDEPHHGKANRPLNPDIIRERYKFTCAPSLGDDIDPLLYTRRLEQTPLLQLRSNDPLSDAKRRPRQTSSESSTIIPSSNSGEPNRTGDDMIGDIGMQIDTPLAGESSSPAMVSATINLSERFLAEDAVMASPKPMEGRLEDIFEGPAVVASDMVIDTGERSFVKKDGANF